MPQQPHRSHLRAACAAASRNRAVMPRRRNSRTRTIMPQQPHRSCCAATGLRCRNSSNSRNRVAMPQQQQQPQQGHVAATAATATTGPSCRNSRISRNRAEPIAVSPRARQSTHTRLRLLRLHDARGGARARKHAHARVRETGAPPLPPPLTQRTAVAEGRTGRADGPRNEKSLLQSSRVPAPPASRRGGLREATRK
jgi:hypothetical protein